MPRSAISWLVVFAVLFGGFFASVGALNADLYSAHGFVRTYLDALARQDSAAALAIDGVGASDGAATTLLSDEALGELSDIRLVRDTAQPDGSHTVVYDYRLASGEARSEFHVQPSGTRFGLFTDWRFVASPLSTIAVSVKHDSRFTVNGLPVGSAGAYLVFAPGLYVLDHTSTFLQAKAVDVAVTEPGTISDATVDVQANDEFVSTMQSEVDGFLEGCSAQTVLQPTGCPFGRPVNNQVKGDPEWSIIRYPSVVIEPGANNGEWMVNHATGTANITATVRSLFDGTISTLDENIDFVVNYRVTFSGGELVIEAV